MIPGKYPAPERVRERFAAQHTESEDGMPSQGGVYNLSAAHEAHGLEYTGIPTAPWAAVTVPVPENVWLVAVVEPDDDTANVARITLWEVGDDKTHFVVRTFGAGTCNPRTMGLCATRRRQGKNLVSKLEGFVGWVVTQTGMNPAVPDWGCVLTRWSGRFPNPTTSVLAVGAYA